MDDFREPKLDVAIERAGESEGWAFFDQQEKGQVDAAARRINEARERVGEAAAALYAGSPEFRIVLEWLLDQTLRRATWSPQLGISMDQICGHGCFREGQNAIAEALLKAIAAGLKMKPPQNEVNHGARNQRQPTARQGGAQDQRQARRRRPQGRRQGRHGRLEDRQGPDADREAAMTLGLCFWIIMLVLVVFTGLIHFGVVGGLWAGGSSIVQFVLFVLLGWQVFGPPLRR